MALNAERRLQKFLGDTKRVNEIDPRPVTRAFQSPRALAGLPYQLGRIVLRELGYEAWRHTLGRAKRLSAPIFMLGMGHSGTTISMELFARHPDVVNQSEANVLFQPEDYLDFGNCDHLKTAEDASASENRRLHGRFEFRRSVSGKKRFFNKCPANVFRIEFLQAVFPDAFFIHVIRHGGPVVNSMIYSLPAAWETEDRLKPWRERVNPFPSARPPNWRELLRDDPVEQLALQWRECITYVLDRRDLLGPAYHQIKYEDLCEDPRRVIGDAFRFAGLGADEELLATLPPSLENRNYKWRENLTEAQQKCVLNIQGPLLRELGYQE